MEIEEALERAHTWLRDQTWWSDEEDAIIAVSRINGARVIGHTLRELAAAGEATIGGYGPLVITDGGGIIPAESCITDSYEEVLQRLESVVRIDQLHSPESV